MKFDGFLALYQEGRDDPTDDDEDRRRLPAMSAGEALGSADLAVTPAFHRAAAALLRSLAGQAHGRARHRPALDLRLDPAGAAGPRLCPARQEAPHAGGQGPRRDRVPGELLRAATSNTTSPPSWKSSSTTSPPTRSPGSRCCAISGRDFIGAVDDIKDLRVAAGDRRARRDARAASLPGARRRHRSAQVPDLRHRPALAQARQVRRLRRLLELSRMPLHPASSRPAAATATAATRMLGNDPGDRARRHGALRPLRPLYPARRAGPGRRRQAEKPKRAGLPKGISPDDVDLERALGLLSLPREVGKHPETANRSSPASAASALTCSTARPTPTSTRRGRADHRAQPRGDADRGEEGPKARARAGSAPIRAGPWASIPTRADRSW